MQFTIPAHQEGKMTIAATLAEFATMTTFEDLPSCAVEHAKIIIASTIASAAMGREIGSTNVFREMAKERGGSAEASIWFDTGSRLPAMDAARTNAIMSDAAASDDTDLSAVAHIGTVTSTAAIAMGERQGATGGDVIAAIVLGYEVANRIGKHAAIDKVGFHPGVITIFGATVAAGKLMRLTAEQMTHAISLAATSIGGIHAAAPTSWAREYDAALSSTLAFTAAMSAAKGFTCETRILEMPRGYFEIFQGHDLKDIAAGIGETWGIVDDLAIKLMPGTWAYHALAEAAWTAASEGNISPDQVKCMSVRGRRFGGHMVYHPTDLIGVAHSLPYMLAAAVVDRTYSWGHAAPEKYLDPIIGAVQDKVVREEEPSPYADRGGGTVTITTTNERTYSITIKAPRGSGPRGIDWVDIEAKYCALVPLAGLSPQRIDESLCVIRTFDQARGASSITDLLR
jgi:2-methylcitrate dehydratase PrpD